VKLGLPILDHPQLQNEWMWFQVRTAYGVWPHVRYAAELVNTPVYVRNARRGDHIVFRPEHIYAVIHDSELRPADQREEAP
jgi:hypothetical protein